MTLRNHYQCTIALLLVGVATTVLVGCNKANDSTVSGRVTMDGKPLDHGSVVFTKASGGGGAAATGGIRSDGAFQVQIGQSGELVAGEYAVSVSSRAPSIPSPEGGPPTPGDLLTPQKYANSSTSGLRYQVRAGKNVIDIALTGEEATVENADTTEPEEPASATDSASETESTDVKEVDETEVDEMATDDDAEATESNE